MEGNYTNTYETFMQDGRRLLQFGSFGKRVESLATKLIVTFISKRRFQTQRIALFKTGNVNQNHSVELNHKARNFDSKQTTKT